MDLSSKLAAALRAATGLARRHPVKKHRFVLVSPHSVLARTPTAEMSLQFDAPLWQHDEWPEHPVAIPVEVMSTALRGNPESLTFANVPGHEVLTLNGVLLAAPAKAANREGNPELEDLERNATGKLIQTILLNRSFIRALRAVEVARAAGNEHAHNAGVTVDLQRHRLAATDGSRLHVADAVPMKLHAGQFDRPPLQPFILNAQTVDHMLRFEPCSLQLFGGPEAGAQSPGRAQPMVTQTLSQLQKDVLCVFRSRCVDARPHDFDRILGHMPIQDQHEAAAHAEILDYQSALNSALSIRVPNCTKELRRYIQDAMAVDPKAAAQIVVDIAEQRLVSPRDTPAQLSVPCQVRASSRWGDQPRRNPALFKPRVSAHQLLASMRAAGEREQDWLIAKAAPWRYEGPRLRVAIMPMRPYYER